jgi:hypothetical protein
MFRFTIRDVLWLTVVVALVAVWRSDLARQEAAYLETLKPRFPWDSEMREIAVKAKGSPKLLAELNAFVAAEMKFSASSAEGKRAIHQQYMALKEMAGIEPQPPIP